MNLNLKSKFKEMRCDAMRCVPYRRTEQNRTGISDSSNISKLTSKSKRV
jgi:hypothetical protein